MDTMGADNIEGRLYQYIKAQRKTMTVISVEAYEWVKYF